MTVFNASIPRIVDEQQLIAANGLLQSISAIGLIAGSIIGGIEALKTVIVNVLMLILNIRSKVIFKMV